MELPNLQTSFSNLNGQQRTETTKYRQTDCTGGVSLSCNSLSLSSSTNRRLCHVEQAKRSRNISLMLFRRVVRSLDDARDDRVNGISNKFLNY